MKIKSIIIMAFLGALSACNQPEKPKSAAAAPSPAAAPAEVRPADAPVAVTAVTPAGTPAGEVVFQHYCEACHGFGHGHPGTIALQAKYNGQEPAMLSERKDLDPDTIHFFVRNGVSVMPPFRKTEVSDQDLQDLIAYLTRNNPKTEKK